MSDGSRSEKPTQRRLQKAREEGRFAVSREFVSGLQFVAFVAMLTAFAPAVREGLLNITRVSFTGAFRGELTAHRVYGDLLNVVLPSLSALALIAGVLIATSVAAQLATTQMGIASSQLSLDINRLNPVAKLTSLRRQNVPAFVQAVVLLPVFGVTVWSIIRPRIEEFVTLPLTSLPSAMDTVFGAVSSLLWKAALAYVVLGAVDLFRQRQRYEKDLKMTPQEVREEHKELEGNPQIKMRIRRIQRDLLRRNMMKEVPSASAVITNPTHYAVAIRYNFESSSAPVVLAKSKNYLARRIKERAIEHNVPIVENPPLAQALYKTVDIGQEIPPNLYRAVAEVLAYIFRLTQGRV